MIVITQPQYESVGFKPNLLIIQVFKGKYVIKALIMKRR